MLSESSWTFYESCTAKDNNEHASQQEDKALIRFADSAHTILRSWSSTFVAFLRLHKCPAQSRGCARHLCNVEIVMQFPDSENV